MEHEGQTFHDEVEVPRYHSVRLALSMPASIDNGSAHFGLGVTDMVINAAREAAKFWYRIS